MHLGNNESSRADLFPETPASRTYIHTTCGGATTVEGEAFRRLANPWDLAVGTVCVKCNSGGFYGEFAWADTGEKLSSYRRRLRFRNPISGGSPWIFRILLLILLPTALTVLAVVCSADAVPSERNAWWKIGLTFGFILASAIILLIHRFRPVDFRRYM